MVCYWEMLYRLPWHTLTRKKDYNIRFRLCYNAIHIAICVLQRWHRRRYRVSVFSITTELEKESNYPLDHYTWHFQLDKYFSISYTKMSPATNDRYESPLLWFLVLSHCIWIIRNTVLGAPQSKDITDTHGRRSEPTTIIRNENHYHITAVHDQSLNVPGKPTFNTSFQSITKQCRDIEI